MLKPIVQSGNTYTAEALEITFGMLLDLQSPDAGSIDIPAVMAQTLKVRTNDGEPEFKGAEFFRGLPGKPAKEWMDAVLALYSEAGGQEPDPLAESSSVQPKTMG